MTTSYINDENTVNNLSQQVKEILSKKGFSKIYNDTDLQYFASQAKGAFNKADAIAQKFLEYFEDTQSDFNEYIF